MSGCRTTLRNLHGLRNVNVKVIDAIETYLREHPDENVRVYCCVDRESRYETVPDFDLQRIVRYVKEQNLTSVLSIHAIIATQQIESWFFHDIAGIYQYLGAPKSHRKKKGYKPPNKFGCKDLQILFERYGKTYSKGRRSQHFIDQLNINKIISDCKELTAGINLIKSQAKDPSNHIFLK
ncbi:MAG: hypothetical protein ACYTEL_19495 [Planctomycetota bacterium]